MNLQDQVCTIEQAKKLRELGVKQDGYFIHFKNKYPDEWKVKRSVFFEQEFGRFADDAKQGNEWCSAFSVAELGIMIGSGYYTYHHLEGNYTCWGSDKELILYKEFYPTEAQARASLLIHLIENKIVTVEQINKRLS